MFNFFIQKAGDLGSVGGVPLNRARKGVLHRITAISTDKGMRQKLMELGLPPGSEVKIMQHQASGGAVVAKDNLRIALGPSLTAQILVNLI